MVHQHDKLARLPGGGVERGFIQILYDDVVVIASEILVVVSLRDERIGVSRPNSMNVDTIKRHARWSIGPRATQQIDVVPASHDSAENFPEMKLGTPRLRIGVILPVEDEYAH